MCGASPRQQDTGADALVEQVLSTEEPSWSVLQGFALGLTLPAKLCKSLLTQNLGAAV